MTPVVEFFCPGTPVPFRWRAHGKRRYVPERQAAWTRAITSAAWPAQKGRKPATGAVHVVAEFTFPAPKKVKRQEHTVRPDLTNCYKLVEDACTGAGVWNDDCQVTSVALSKRYGAEPGVRVAVFSA